MAKRWFVLALLAGAATAGVCWLWPQGPLWRSGPYAGEVRSFTPDGGVLISAFVPPRDKTGQPSPVVYRWNAATGELLSRATMACADPAKLKLVHPSEDGRLALVGEGGPPPNTGVASFGTGDWYLHDGITGDRRDGPFPGVVMAYRNAFSLDGRWFHGLRDPFSGRPEEPRNSAIRSVATGEVVVELRDHDELTADCVFAADGSSAAVFWSAKKYPRGETAPTVEVIELPSGKLRRRCELPRRSWTWARQWDGRYLEMMTELPSDSAGRAPSRSCVFDLTQEAIGVGVEYPLLTVYHFSQPGPHFWQRGDGWLVFFTIHRIAPTPPWYQKTRDWILAEVGLGALKDERRHIAAKFVDPVNGELRYEVPGLLQATCLVSPDGRYLASRAGEDAVEVWQIPPPSRWPIVLAAGLGVAVSVALFGRYRGKRFVLRKGA